MECEKDYKGWIWTLLIVLLVSILMLSFGCKTSDTVYYLKSEKVIIKDYYRKIEKSDIGKEASEKTKKTIYESR